MKLRTFGSHRPIRTVLVAVVGTAALVLTACGSTTGASDAPTSGGQSVASSDTSSSTSSAAATESPSASSSQTPDTAAGSSDASSSGASSAAVDPKSLLPANLAAKGTITVGSDIEYPPFEAYAADNTTVVGLDRDVADGIEKQLGVKLEFQNAAFDSLIPGLAAGRYDMVMSAMTDTTDREKQVDFVDYVKAGGGILLPADNPHGIKTPDDLCGLNIAIDKGTTEVDDATFQSDKCVKDGKKAINPSIYPGNNQMILALQTGRADAALVDSVSGEQVAHESNGKLIMLPPYNESYFGIVFPKGSDQLQKAVQAALQAMAADGSYHAIFEKYGLGDATVDAFTINGAITTSGGLGS
ncbi:MAG: ABC transporter substrate-binding protein [Nakamurella sp.]